jgi:chromatin remodeling complex protein RSC6
MNVPVGTNQSRVAVTNALCAYIKTKNLQNQANKRQILPDAELIELLGYTGDVAATPSDLFLHPAADPEALCQAGQGVRY